MAHFSVIIPTYNRASLILEALDSVYNQTFKDFEVIVIDDGSTDGTENIVRTSGFEVRYYRQENQGPGAARNRGVEVAFAPIVAFLDSDDVWFPWTLETYKLAFENSDLVSWVAGMGVDFRDSSELDLVSKAPYRRKIYPNYLATSKEGIWIGTCASAIRRSVFLAVGGFLNSNHCAEDSDLWLKLGVDPGFCSIQEPIVFAYRRHSGTAVGDLNSSAKGMDHLIESEKLKRYPGGDWSASRRREIITRHIRPVSITLIEAGFLVESLQLFLRTLWWNLCAYRIRYILGFPFIFLSGAFKSLKILRNRS